MSDFIEMMQIGLGLGAGFYIGFEGLKAVTEAIAAGLRYLFDLIVYDDEEE